MTQIEAVALWAGLLASVVGIVLAGVAIVFSLHVDRRTSKIGDHTIQSLQKIESAVEHLSSDTRELIKAGWDKMLGGVDKGHAAGRDDSTAQEIAAGIAAELRAELGSLPKGGESTEARASGERDIEALLKNFEQSLVAQLRAQPSDSRPGETFDRIMATVSRLQPRTYGLLRGISRSHLTRPEYTRLSEGPFADAVTELRTEGLLVPVLHRAAGREVPCYWMPPGAARMVLAALQLLPETPEHLREQVRSELRRVGYSSDEDRPGHRQLPPDSSRR